MSRLYVAAENIPAGFEVIVEKNGAKAYGLGAIGRGIEREGFTVIGTAGETLRRGFRIVSRAGEVYEDDA